MTGSISIIFVRFLNESFSSSFCLEFVCQTDIEGGWARVFVAFLYFRRRDDCSAVQPKGWSRGDGYEILADEF